MSSSREQLFNLLDQSSVVETLLLEAYKLKEERVWRENLDSNTHGNSWATSFHASQFPGDDPYACGRKAIYELMEACPEKPIEPHLRALFDSGKNLELEWVNRFAYLGVLLSADQTAGDKFQTGFEDPEYWLTGGTDAIVVPRFWNKSHIVEIKTTSHDKVVEMKEGSRQAEPKHIRQGKTYIGLANEQKFAPVIMRCMNSGLPMQGVYCAEHLNEYGGCRPTLVQLDPPDDGTVIYSSRDKPLFTQSYHIEYDPEFMKKGREILRLWREHFLLGAIPPHPREGQRAKWSVDPCQWCPWKKNICKPDYENEITEISTSHLTKHNQVIRSTYSPELAREAVLKRWKVLRPRDGENGNYPTES